MVGTGIENSPEDGAAGSALLVDFETHLNSKAQFLLDAILGFINTKQNEIFRVLTVVSVVGIPPTLIASMYGMNFHNMPELGWRWGYPLRFNADRVEYPAADSVVQAPRMVVEQVPDGGRSVTVAVMQVRVVVMPMAQRLVMMRV